MKVLFVEDDEKIALFVTRGLREDGYQVDHFANGQDGFHASLGLSYDLAIVDIMLPAMDGLAIIDQWRARGIDLPVLILSARRSVDDRLKGFRSGGDDYLCKPFALAELLARTGALLRRASHVTEPNTLRYYDLSLDLHSHRVARRGRNIVLQPREFSLLEYLMRNPERVISKAMIIEHVWDYNFDPQTNLVETRICRLRDKVDRDFPRSLIHTVRGVGYVLRKD